MPKARRATVLVIGAGQAGLSAAYHLRRRGFADALAVPGADRTYAVVDHEQGPGGAWRHRWPSLTMATVNGIFDLPGMPQEPADPAEPSRIAVPRYFAAFEERFALPIQRIVRVTDVRRADLRPDGDLLVGTDHGGWRVRAVINATGTWTNPVWPDVPGREAFAGRQLHTHDYATASAFAGMRVGIVGGGISALQHLAEVSSVARTFWYTRRPVVFREGFAPEQEGRETIEKVTAAVEAGLPPRSIVSYTGLIHDRFADIAEANGALVRRPMFGSIVPAGVVEADGTVTGLEVLLWATGFRSALGHLDALDLHNAFGGITMRGTQVAGEPRVHLIGYGPSQSTVGANRAGRDAVAAILRWLRH